MFEAFIALIIGLVVGAAGGWYLYSKYGSKVQALEQAVKKV